MDLVPEDEPIPSLEPYSFQTCFKYSHKSETASTSETPSQLTPPSQSTRKLEQLLLFPSVRFPLIETLTSNLKSGFNELSELLPPLPCELDLLNFRLGFTKPLATNTLVIDIDNTLVLLDKSSGYKLHKYARTFLETLSCCFEIVLFSPYSDLVTKDIVAELGPERVTRVIYANSVIRRERHHILDLRIFVDRDPRHIVLLSASVVTFAGWLENGIYGNGDNLKEIMEFLLTLQNMQDVRPLVTKFAGLTRLLQKYNKGDYEEEAIVDQEEEIEEVPEEYE